MPSEHAANFFPTTYTRAKMRSPKQIEASRINGRRSQGPITPQGKYNSSRNNLRHGLLAQTVVLEKDSEERFRALLDDYMLAADRHSFVWTMPARGPHHSPDKP